MKRAALLVLAVALPLVAAAQDTEITSFHGNGLVTWTNAPEHSNRTYRVEWSCDLMSNQWLSSWASLTNIAHSADGMSAAVPMFYRVVMNPRDIVVATTGNDTSGQGTADSPLATIQKAIDLAIDGDRIIVKPGTYSGMGNRNLLVDGKNISLISEAGPLVTTIDCGGVSRALVFSGTMRNTLFSGFTIANGYLNENRDWGYGGIILIDDDAAPTIDRCILVSNTVTSSYFTAQPALVTFKTTADAVLRNSLIASNTVNGGWYSGGGYSAIIRSYNNGDISRVENCTISANNLSGHLRNPLLWFRGTIANVIDWDNNGSEAYETDQYGFSATINMLLSDSIIGDDIITNDPLFVSAGTFSVQLGSPAIDAGTNFPWMSGATDLPGNTRIVGAAVDLGAYERQ